MWWHGGAGLTERSERGALSAVATHDFHEKAVKCILKFTSTGFPGWCHFGHWRAPFLSRLPGTTVPPAPLGDGRGEVPLRGFRGDPQAVKLATAWRGPGRQPRPVGMTWDLASIRTLVEWPVGPPVHDLIRVSIHREKGGTLLSC